MTTLATLSKSLLDASLPNSKDRIHFGCFPVDATEDGLHMLFTPDRRVFSHGEEIEFQDWHAEFVDTVNGDELLVATELVQKYDPSRDIDDWAYLRYMERSARSEPPDAEIDDLTDTHFTILDAYPNMWDL